DPDTGALEIRLRDGRYLWIPHDGSPVERRESGFHAPQDTIYKPEKRDACPLRTRLTEAMVGSTMWWFDYQFARPGAESRHTLRRGTFQSYEESGETFLFGQFLPLCEGGVGA